MSCFLAGLVFAASVLIRLSGEDPVSEQVSTQGFLCTKLVGVVPSLYLLCPASLDLSKENASTDVGLLADLGEKAATAGKGTGQMQAQGLGVHLHVGPLVRGDEVAVRVSSIFGSSLRCRAEAG